MTTATIDPPAAAADPAALAARFTPLARRLAWRQFNRSSRRPPLDDLQGEALLALALAIRRFDPGRGVPFEAWAATVIGQRLTNYAKLWRPGHRYGYTRFTDLQAGGNAATGRGRCDDASAGLVDPPDRGAERFAERAGDRLDGAALFERIRRRVPARWAEAVRLYYGDGLTLDQVGERLGISRERTRQLILKAKAAVAIAGENH